jgi:hypothetical protein
MILYKLVLQALMLLEYNLYAMYEKLDDIHKVILNVIVQPLSENFILIKKNDEKITTIR